MGDVICARNQRASFEVLVIISGEDKNWSQHACPSSLQADFLAAGRRHVPVEHNRIERPTRIPAPDLAQSIFAARDPFAVDAGMRELPREAPAYQYVVVAQQYASARTVPHLRMN